jgi:hypothetical protein
MLELKLAIADTRASAAAESVLLYKALAGGWPQYPFLIWEALHQ